MEIVTWMMYSAVACTIIFLGLFTKDVLKDIKIKNGTYSDKR